MDKMDAMTNFASVGSSVKIEDDQSPCVVEALNGDSEGSCHQLRKSQRRRKTFSRLTFGGEDQVMKIKPMPTFTPMPGLAVAGGSTKVNVVAAGERDESCSLGQVEMEANANTRYPLRSRSEGAGVGGKRKKLDSQVAGISQRKTKSRSRTSNRLKEEGMNIMGSVDTITKEMPKLRSEVKYQTKRKNTNGSDCTPPHLPPVLDAVISSAMSMETMKGKICKKYHVSLQMVQLRPSKLLSPPTDQINKELVEAVQARDLKTVVSLLEAGGDPNHRIDNSEGLTLLMTAVGLGDLLLVQKLCCFKANPNLADKFGCNPLILGGVHDHPDIVRCLLANGADPDLQISTNGMTALHVMAKDDHVNSASAMNLPKRMKLLHNRDKDQLTPLMTACKFGSFKMVNLFEQLVSHGQLLSAIDKYGGCAIHWAAFGGNLSIVLALIKLGADVNATDNDRNTPLHFALSSLLVRKNRVRIAEALINHGALTQLCNTSGNTAFDLCCSSISKQLISLRDRWVKNQVGVVASHCNVWTECLAETFQMDSMAIEM